MNNDAIYKIQKNAYAKVNLGLDVLKKRPDGYHEVKMIMQSIDLHDTLTLEKTPYGITMTSDAGDLPNDQSNLAYRAADILFQDSGIEGGVHIHLEKNIPIAAGMAGGSTDAAAVFTGLNELYEMGYSQEKLCQLAKGLGADIPYCIWSGTALSEGIGEKLTALSPMPSCYMLIAKPAVGVSTGAVYGGLDIPSLIHPDIDGQIAALEAGDLYKLCSLAGNVLETVTIPMVPVIDQIKNQMKKDGALLSLMSGSGPTVFGIFDNEGAAKAAEVNMLDGGLAKDVILTRPHNL